MKKVLTVVMLAVGILLLTSCLAGPSNDLTARTVEGRAAGFFKGLWHGFILMFSFIFSLFSDHVGVYEIHNIGGWYDLGFLLGVMIFFSGSGRAGTKVVVKRK